MVLGYFLNYYLPPKKGRVGEIRKGTETILVTKQRLGRCGASWLLLSSQILLCYVLKLGPLSSQQADFPSRTDSWNN